MNNPFLFHLDFIFFFYGLSFIVLGAVCFVLTEDEGRLFPWHFLGWFGFIHGLYEWLDLLAMTMGSPPWFSLLRLGVMLLSYYFLLRFGWKGSWGWTIVLLLPLLLLAGWSGGLAMANGATRYVLALPTCLLAAQRLLAGIQPPVDPRRKKLLTIAAGAMALYGISAGLAAPASGLWPALYLNPDSFMAATGLPIQLVRGILASLLTLAVWELPANPFQAIRDKRRRFFRIFIAILFLATLSGWLLTNHLGKLHSQEMLQDNDAEVNFLHDHLAGEIHSVQATAQLLASMPPIRQALEGIQGDTLQSADFIIDRFSDSFQESLIFLLNRQGIVVHAANRQAPDSPIGHDFSFRPYFQQALGGMPSAYFAMGTLSDEPGFYVGFPVYDARREIIGVVAIKKKLDACRLEMVRHEHSYLATSEGMVILSSRPEINQRSLWPLSPAMQQRIRDSRQFSAPNFSPLFSHPPSRGELVELDGKKEAVGRAGTPEQGWFILLLREEKSFPVNRFFGILITALVSSLVLASFIFLQKEILVEMALVQSQEQLRSLGAYLEEVREQEQKKIARDLHDELGSLLTRLKMDLALWCNTSNQTHSAESQNRLQGISQLADQMFQTVRRITTTLRPMLLDQFGLLVAMESMAQNFSKHTAIAFTIRPDSQDIQLEDKRKTALFRICQESLTNIARHSGATRAEITLSLEEEAIVLHIQDDGVGIQPEEAEGNSSFGIRGMRERAWQFHGSVEISSLPSGGTSVVARLPRAPEDRWEAI